MFLSLPCQPNPKIIINVMVRTLSPQAFPATISEEAACLSENVFYVMIKAAAVFAAGSLFDLFKAYGAIYKDK